MIFSPIQVDCLLCAIIANIIVPVLLAFNFLLVLFFIRQLQRNWQTLAQKESQQSSGEVIL